MCINVLVAIQKLDYRKVSTLSVFNEGISFYLNQLFKNANDAFSKVLAIDDDATARFFYQHITQLLESGVNEKKSGIVEMEEK